MESQQQVSASDTYTIVGLLLTLVSLLATFFSVQLSQWLMSLIATNAKWDAHSSNSDSESMAKRRECRAELAGSYNGVVFGVTVALGSFVGFIICCCFKALRLIRGEPLKSILNEAIVVFSVCYFLLTCGLLVAGYLMIGLPLSKKINGSG